VVFLKLHILFFNVYILLIVFSASAISANVMVQKVVTERSKQEVQAVGNAEAIRSVILFPAVADKVTAVHFKPGDRVKEGDVLVELDSRRQKTALQEAEITLSDTARTLKRLTKSHQQGAIPQSELDDAKTLHSLAKVALTNAKTELEDREIRAPFDGVMGLTEVEKGDRITVQTAIASIDDTRSLYINFNAPESAIALLKNQGRVQVTPWQSSHVINAEVAYLDSRINPQTRTLRVKAKLDNAAEQFMPGMSFRVIISIEGDAYAVVPEAALMWGATGPYIWKSIDNKAKRVDVKIEQRLAGRLLVSGELNLDDMLVVEGVQRLRENQALTVTNTSAVQE
jgi:membrane fusion protein, multidrug efflux system